MGRTRNMNILREKPKTTKRDSWFDDVQTAGQNATKVLQVSCRFSMNIQGRPSNFKISIEKF